MAGSWRVSDEEELDKLRRLSREARHLRTEDAWNRLAVQVARCEHLGVLDTVGEEAGDAVAETPAEPTDERPEPGRRYVS
jgi:hypothetical protein